MACQKVCKQGRDDMIVKENLQSPIPTSFYITVELMLKRCRDEAFVNLPSLYHIIPTLFAYFLACHPYILLHFKCFLSLVYMHARLPLTAMCIYQRVGRLSM